ncbi:hypothetical protein TKK_0011739 [Trichogramma kaykai]
MDFRFDVNKIFPKRINKITQTLLPEGFRGDRREYNDTQRLLSRIIDDVGEASAKAQGLNRTITTAQKLRDTDHIVYLMVDKNGNNGNGSVVGLLKTGSKTLFMFDEDGAQYRLTPRCILDFYIHESRQRMGLGKELYEFMLKEESMQPIKLAIDRPSEKFLKFLVKHYHLERAIPQNNKFVVFKGFFDNEVEDAESAKVFTSPLTNNRAIEYSARTNSIVDSPSRAGSRCNSINGTPSKYSIGRYAASRPPSFMADIIHNVATPEKHKFNSRTCTDTKNFYGDYSLPQNGSTSTGATYYHDEIAAEDVVDRAAEVQANYEADHQPYNTCDEDRAPAGFKEHWQTKTSPPEQTTTEEDKSLAKNFGQLSLDNGGGDDKASNNGHDDKNSRFDEEEYRNPAGEDAQLPYGAHLDIKFYHSPLW